jgi:short-subunit dehydrogenase
MQTKRKTMIATGAARANLQGYINLTQLAVKQMPAQNSGAIITRVTSAMIAADQIAVLVQDFVNDGVPALVRRAG